MEALDAFFEWAWARHHNVLSWYVRPLFLVPYCAFAYRRSGWGIAVTVLALLTSMFWFPAPTEPSPAVVDALRAEREYLFGPWTWWKVTLALLVPLTFAALAVAFWRRSLRWGLAVLNGMVLIKVVWTFVFFSADSVWAHLTPALAGLAVCDAAIFWWLARRKQSKHAEPGAAADGGGT
jgi:hypothetical protein